MSNEKVDAYIANAQPFARPILEHVRTLVHRALPNAQEAIKWGVPYFVVNGKNAVGMAAFMQHASVIVCSDEIAGGGMGNFGKLTGIGQLPADDELIARFRESAQAVQSSETMLPKAKPKIAVPDDFAALIAATSGTQAIWDSFTDAQRRDYLEWITTAKRETTRAKRIATATEWIGEGKKRNWKYESC